MSGGRAKAKTSTDAQLTGGTYQVPVGLLQAEPRCPGVCKQCGHRDSRARIVSQAAVRSRAIGNWGGLL